MLVSTFILGTAALAFYVFQLETDFVEAIALEDAESFSKALTEFRTLYTSEVVERVRGQGIQVTHDYLEQTGAIPLPVTLSMLLGQRLDVGSTSKVRLYSKHPFPWRKSTGGPHDQFERDALAHLETHPQQPFYRFEEGVKQTRLRFATADLMRKVVSTVTTVTRKAQRSTGKRAMFAVYCPFHCH